MAVLSVTVSVRLSSPVVYGRSGIGFMFSVKAPFCRAFSKACQVEFDKQILLKAENFGTPLCKGVPL